MPYKNAEDRDTYRRNYYLANREKFLQSALRSSKRRREKVRKLIRAAKDKPCIDCGIKYPYYVMQLDHLDSETKRFELNRAASLGWAPDDLANEIAKCDVVCANCHAERSHQRRVAGRGFEPPTSGL